MPPDKPRIDVFISSTSIDLPDHRAAVRDALVELGLFPSGMETWPVGADLDPVTLCKGKIDDAEIYIGIYAHRYGWRPDGYDGKSITELEYDWAGEKPIPRLCFIMSDSHPWPSDQMEHDAKANLDAFKKRVKAKQVGFFTTPENLKSQVLAALANLPEVRQVQAAVRSQCNLVPKPEHFAGRVNEIDKLRADLTGKEAIAITAVRGLGGIGKTTLVKHFANIAELPFELRLWAELGQNFREDMEANILKNWARRLFDYEFPSEAQIEQIRATVAHLLSRQPCGTPTLLVLDDVWEHTMPVARNLKKLVLDLPELNAHVLVTTRSEAVAADLDCPATRLQKLTPPEGADLIMQIVPQASDQRAQLEALSAILGGHPLALKLAARQMRPFSPRKLDRLIETTRAGLAAGDAFPDLKLEQADAQSKEDSVSITLRQTLDNLDADLQAKFRALGALPADLPFRADHIFVLWEAEDEDALDALIAEGLLTPETDADWYSQHRLLRAYARALARDELDAAIDHHRQYVIQFADQVFDQPPEEWKDLHTQADLDQIHALGDELAATLAGTDDPDEQPTRLKFMSENVSPSPNHDDPAAELEVPRPGGEGFRVRASFLQTCSDFGNAVTPYIFRRYIGLEGRRWLWAGLIAARSLESQYRTGLFASILASWHRQRGYMQDALTYYNQSLEMDKKLEDQTGEATTLNNIGAVWSALGEKRKALVYYEQALPLQQAVGDRGGEATTLNNIGEVYRQLGENQKALGYYEQALRLYEAVGDRGGEATTLNNIGAVYRQLGENQKALDYYEQALPLVQAVGDPYGEAITRYNMAHILWEQGDHDTALEHMQIARDLNARIGISTEDEDYWLAQWHAELGLPGADE